MATEISTFIGQHPVVSLVLLVVVGGSLTFIFSCLAYRKADSRLRLERTHNGPYRPPVDLKEHARQSVDAHRERIERSRLELINSNLRERRN